MRSRLVAILVVMLAGIIASGGAVAMGAEGPVRLELRLHDAVRGKVEGPAPGGPVLMLYTERVGERWDRVIGIAGELNVCIHSGYVSKGTMTKDGIEMTIPMHIYSDIYVPGGEAEYTLKLQAKGDGRYEGRFEGTYRGKAASGKAEGRVLPAQKVAADFVPIAAGEHPRLLFRKSDLPALREKAKTAFGRAVLEKMDDDIGLGIKYQLTGDKKYAEEAKAIVEKILNGDYSSARTKGSHHGILHYGWVWEHPAVTYDLCYDAWDEAFKRRVERYCMLWAQRLIYQRFMFNTQGQYNYGNPEAGQLYYGNALGALAVWGEKGQAPMKPVEVDGVVDVAAEKDFKAGKDVPVVGLELGKSPRKWLVAEVVPAIVNGDPLEELGGLAKVRPETGTAFTFEGKRYAFAPVAEEFVAPNGGLIVNLGKSLQPNHVKTKPGPELAKDGPITWVAYTVLENAEPRLVKVRAGASRFGSQQFVLAGHTLYDGQVVRLEKGVYPLTVVMRIKPRWDYQEPALMEATEEDLVNWQTVVVPRLKGDYERNMNEYEYKLEEWKRTGVDPEYQEYFEIARFQMYLHQREAGGTGGAQATVSGESYALGLHPALFASAFRKSFGYDVSPYSDLTMFLTRRIFAHVYGENGEMVDQEIHGPNDLGADYFAFSFPLVPEEWKPAVLWAWNRHCGVTDVDNPPAKLMEGGNVASRVFVNYPLGMEAKAPKGILPLTWEAPDFGYFGFRNTWEGKDDFVVQVYGQSRNGKGYTLPNAGTYRIMGLGYEWNRGFPSVRLDNRRYFDPVLLLPEDETNEGGQGKVTFSKMEADGSGQVTVDLKDVYCAEVKYARYGGGQKEGTFKESGITGLRAFAVDYSGKSGAPCMFVVVDKVLGGKTKVWPWYLAGVKTHPKTGKVLDVGDIARTKVEGNKVTVTQVDGTTMQLTFVGPADAVVKAETRTLRFNKTYNRGEGVFTAPGIFASGTDATNGEFFVIVTIQKGAAPQPVVEGKGLGAKVTIGKQTVRFDGEKIVVGDGK